MVGVAPSLPEAETAAGPPAGAGAGAPGPARRRLRLPPWRRLRVALAIWAVLVAGALVLADRLDEPVGSGALDAAQPIVAGPVVDPGFEPQPGAPTGSLPPIALVVGDPQPADVASLPLDQRVPRLRALAEREDTPLAWTRLGAAEQESGDGLAAEASYRRALTVERGYLPALVGLIMVDAGTGPEGLARAGAGLDELARRRPDSQVVHFNRGLVAAYSRDGQRAVAAWMRTAEIDRRSNLGRAAVDLLRQIAQQGPAPRTP